MACALSRLPARSRLLGLAWALGLLPAPARADGEPLPPPLAWQEPAPLARMFLQLPFEAPEVAPAGSLVAGLRLLYSNSLLVQRSPALVLDVHVETAQPTVFLRYGVAPGVELELALPATVDTGGFLDRPIEIVEGLFGASNPQRRGLPLDVARFQLTRPGGSGVLRDGAEAGPGDVWAGAKVHLVDEDGARPALAVRAALKLPTGRVPFGSGEADLGGSLLAGWTWGDTALRLELDALAPTASFRAAGIATRPYGALDAGLSRRLGGTVTLHLQASGHLSPLGGTGFGQIDDPTFYVLGGVTVDLSRSTWLDAGLVENVFSPYRGADLAFLVTVRSRL